MKQISEATARRKVKARCKELGAEIESLAASGIDRRQGNKFEILAPLGKSFDGCSGLICTGWVDAFERLDGTQVEDEPVE